MPCNYQHYPPDWFSRIRPSILARARHQCEHCGAVNYAPHPATGSRVVLTIAHLDHDVQNNAPSNLAALCQRCHLRLDAQQHAANARKTRQQRRMQLEFLCT